MEVSIRDVTALKAAGGPENGKTMLEILQYLGLRDVEFRFDEDDSVFLPESRERADLSKEAGVGILKEQLDKNGIRIRSFLMSNDFWDNDRNAQIDWILRCSAAARRFGVPVIRINSSTGSFEEGVSMDGVAEASINILSETLKRIPADSGISLGMENHGEFGNDPEYIRTVIKGVGDERMGLTLDSGNFYWFGFPLNELHGVFEEFAPLARHVHVKNINYPAELRNKKREPGYMYFEYVSPVYGGDIDHAALVDVLRRSGYTGTLCLEDESLRKFPPREKIEVLKRDVEHLKQML